MDINNTDNFQSEIGFIFEDKKHTTIRLHFIIFIIGKKRHDLRKYPLDQNKQGPMLKCC
jgi:hypothetical protein